MIDTEALELKIIEFAMKGKLTCQNACENADSFYDEIVSLRNRFQKEGKIAKIKPMEDITEEEKMFSIPENWKWVRINEVLDVVMGQSPKGISVSCDTDGMEFHQGKIFFTHKYLNKSMQRTCEITKIAKANSVLLCVRAPVGVANIVDREICIGRGLCAISSYSDIDPLFIFYFLKICKKRFEMQGTGSTFSAITVDTVKKQLIPLPPKEEMKRIVDILEKAFTLSKKIEDKQKLYASDLEVLKSKIIDAGIQGKLTEQLPDDGTAEELLEQIVEEKKLLIKEKKIKASKVLPEITEDEIPFEIPGNWKWVHLEDTGVLQTGATPPKTDPEYFGNDIPFLSPGEIKDNTIVTYDKQGLSKLGIEKARVVDENSVLQVCIGGSIGKAAINDRKVTFNQQINSVTPIFCDSKFLFYCMTGSHFIGKIQMASAGAATPIINKSRWGELLIPLPPVAEQKRIVDRIDEICLCVKGRAYM